MSTENDTNQGDDDATDRIESERIDGDGVYPFAGLTRWDEPTDIPEMPRNVWDQQSSLYWWAHQQTGYEGHDFGDPAMVSPNTLPARGLKTMVPDLPRASTAEVKWEHPATGEEYTTAKHNAVINPDVAERVEWGFGTKAEVIAEYSNVHNATALEVKGAIEREDFETALAEYVPEEDREEVRNTTVADDALYHIPTDDYTVINPQQFLDPLCDVLRDEELGERVFGELRLDRGGGRGTLDLYADGLHVEAPGLPEEREPIVVGLEVNWDFFGDWSVRACGTGLDWSCTNAIRRLTDREVVKHAGDVEDRIDWHEWWQELLTGVETKADQLAQVIHEASEMRLDFSDLPNDFGELIDAQEGTERWTALYEYAGLPGYLAQEAGKRLRSRADDPYEPTWWDIHSSATYAVTHHSNADRASGGAIEGQSRIANDLLMNPAGMEDTIVENYEADRRDSEQGTLAEEGGGSAEIAAAFETVREKKAQYEERRDEMVNLIAGGTEGE